MEQELAKSLQELSNFYNFFNKCPDSCRQAIIAEELEARESRFAQTNSTYPLVKLRWLKAQLKAREITKDEKHFINVDKLINQPFKKHTDTLAEFVDENAQKSDNELIVLIRSQAEVFYAECLASAARTYLLKNEFAANKIIMLADNLFKREIYKELIFQFEIIAMIQTFIRSNPDYKVEREDRNFIEKTLCQRVNGDFKLDISQELFEFFEKSNIETVTHDYLESGFQTILQSKIINNDNPRGLSHANVQLDSTWRILNHYFNNSEIGTFVQYMNNGIQDSEEFLAKNKLPQPQSFLQKNATCDNPEINSLKNIVSTYKKFLDETKSEEELIFKNRKKNAIINRQIAVNALEVYLSRASTLTLSVKNVVNKFVSEIKAHEPSWSELSFLDKILDILTLGIRAYKRHQSFFNCPERIDLYNTLELSRGDIPPPNIALN